jgi:hypothetical protein
MVKMPTGNNVEYNKRRMGYNVEFSMYQCVVPISS